MKQKRIGNIFIGLLVISAIIIIHEFGHFIWCKVFGIPTHVFSIGFGPRLIGIKLWNTVFQIALLPIGGYVSMDTRALALAPYWQKMVIILAGIFNNFILALGILWFLSGHFWSALRSFNQLFTRALSFITGIQPVGQSEILSAMHGTQLALHTQRFLFFLASINIELAIFNMLPIPMLDGGHALSYTIHAIMETFNINNPTFIHLVYVIICVLLILLLYRSRQKIVD